jgi:hypothetical protein
MDPRHSCQGHHFLLVQSDFFLIVILSLSLSFSLVAVPTFVYRNSMRLLLLLAL